MTNCAVVFQGQGAQRAGMGLDFFEQSPAARAVFEAAEACLKMPLISAIRSGGEFFASTANVQVSLFTVSMAMWAALRESGWKGRAVFAGHSVGEYAALCAAGCLSFENGIQLLKQRGACMAAAAERQHGGMVAVIGRDEAAIRAAVFQSGAKLYPANENSGTQTVFSGSGEQIDVLLSRIGPDCMAVPLKVAGACHSEWMSGAARDFARCVSEALFEPAQLGRVYANLTAEPYVPGCCRHLLSAQIDHPVLWRQTVGRMLDAGIREFVEIGPGVILTPFIRQIAAAAGCRPVCRTVSQFQELQCF